MNLNEFLKQWNNIPMGLTTYLDFKKTFGEDATMSSKVTKSGLLLITFKTEQETAEVVVVVVRGTSNIILSNL